MTSASVRSNVKSLLFSYSDCPDVFMCRKHRYKEFEFNIHILNNFLS